MSALSSAIELYAVQLFRIKTYLILAVATYLCLLYMKSRRRHNLPPGPWGLPVVGYLPFLSQKTPHFQLEELRKKYGNVFGMYLGSRFALFLGDLATAKEGYNLDEFSGRPDGAFPISKESTHFAAINGQPWKTRRKMSVKALRLLGISTGMVQDVSRTQMNIALDRLEAESSSNDYVNVRSILTHATTSVILRLVCGKFFSPEDKVYKTVEGFLKFFAENGEALSPDITMPWTKPFLKLMTTHKKESSQIFDDMERFTRSEIESHQRNRPDIPMDMLDFYLRHFESEDEENRISNISGDTQLMIFAGADTVRGTTEWFLLCMAQYPDIQEKVYQEIESVVGPSGEIRYEDKHQLPYTEATIFESMRYKLLLPINPYHACLEDTKFHGYDIPKDSLVFALLWSIHNSPNYWSHPEEFHPEHFLSEDKSTVNIPDAFLPFSPGKRTCMGDKVALIETYLFCVSLVRRFLILPPADGLNLEGKLRLNMEPRNPVVKLVRRMK